MVSFDLQSDLQSEPFEIYTGQILNWRKEGKVLLNDALNTFYLLLYGMKKGNVLFNAANWNE